MQILITLKSRLFSELLYGFLSKQKNLQAYALCGKGPAPGLKPDIVFVDQHTIDHSLVAQWPGAKFLLIDVGMGDEEMVRLLISYKIHGIISPATDTELLGKALHAVCDGQIWIDNNSIKALLNSADLSLRTSHLGQLNQREREVIDLVCRGDANKEIASKLCLSEQTIKSHLNRIYRKLNVTSRSQVIALVMKHREVGSELAGARTGTVLGGQAGAPVAVMGGAAQ